MKRAPTPRLDQVADLMAIGLNNVAISARLGISVKDVALCIRRIRARMGWQAC